MSLFVPLCLCGSSLQSLSISVAARSRYVIRIPSINPEFDKSQVGLCFITRRRCSKKRSLTGINEHFLAIQRGPVFRGTGQIQQEQCHERKAHYVFRHLGVVTHKARHAKHGMEHDDNQQGS
uniref:Uncharacterized protein n=1 Tax=Candidatus Kentrum sp. FM TaxID=2126340 RepID=A0A450TYD6_9GAMM|nr:MAG: hypothetical protein BECKFM1743A_GA0114220_107923 [Candidatus Kentron sp. FM]VFK20995.1 MAG: hypothetical protein BECKFM1743B_GA0114221_107483 [Candidatus Kentron sp. FM]